MNDQLKSFMTNLGVLCEIWTLVYKNFIGQGMNAKDAMAHTQGFMTAFVAGINNGGKKDV